MIWQVEFYEFEELLFPMTWFSKEVSLIMHLKLTKLVIDKFNVRRWIAPFFTCFILFRSICYNSASFLLCHNKVLSSAKRVITPAVLILVISFMYCKNRTGPSINLWRPQCILETVEQYLLFHFSKAYATLFHDSHSSMLLINHRTLSRWFHHYWSRCRHHTKENCVISILLFRNPNCLILNMSWMSKEFSIWYLSTSK